MDQPSTPATHDPSPTRRTVLIGTGATAVALTAAACGGDDTAWTTEPAGTTTGDPNDSGADVLTTTGDVPAGSGVVVGDVVVTQPQAGAYKAFSTRCPHQGCAVAVDGDKLECPCHNSQFSLDGAVERGPATTDLTPVDITVEGDDIVRS